MTEEELAGLVAANVRRAREARGLTQRAVSEASGVAVPHVSRLEAGAHLPSLKTLLRVAAALGVPVADLLREQRKK